MRNGSSKKFSKIKIVAIIAIIAVAAFGAYWRMSLKKPKVEYRTDEVTKGDLRSVIQATGTLVPVEKVNVGTQISGKITRLYIDYNSEVKKGQLIAEIEALTQEADVEQAKSSHQASVADLASARSGLAKAQNDFARTKTLADKELVSKAELDASLNALNAAKAQLTGAQARVSQSLTGLKKANDNLNYSKIYSPVDGVVIAKNVESGQTVAASYQTPSIAEIARDLSKMRVEVKVDEADIGGVKTGQDVIFTVDAHANESFRGKVSQVRFAPTVANNIVTYTVIVDVENDKKLLMPGMTANVSLIMSEKKNVLLVPNSAFRFKPEDENAATETAAGPRRRRPKSGDATAQPKPEVYLLGKDNKPERREVERGISDGVNTEIVSGLKNGEVVITGIEIPKEAKK